MLKIHHVALEVANVGKVRDFYINLLGFVEAEKVNFADVEIIFLRNEDFRLELIKADENASASENVHLCFETTSINEMIEKFANSGVTVVEGPYTLQNGWKTVFFKGIGIN